MEKNLNVFSCGVFVMRQNGRDLEFLLMKHRDRWDFPKGHVEKGETELQCALRELEEETGIHKHQVRLQPGFRYTHTYTARYKRFDFKPVSKTLVLFLGWVDNEIKPVISEHSHFQWHKWNPPHNIQEQAIDPLLQFIHDFFGGALPVDHGVSPKEFNAD